MCLPSPPNGEWRPCGDGLRQGCNYVDTFTCKGGGRRPGSLRVQLWNISDAYPGESGAYPYETRRNIPHFSIKNLRELNKLDRFGVWTENPRVGGSIPPLATTNFLSFLLLATGLCRGNPVVVPYLVSVDRRTRSPLRVAMSIHQTDPRFLSDPDLIGQITRCGRWHWRRSN
jgi:hypothetical protein